MPEIEEIGTIKTSMVCGKEKKKREKDVSWMMVEKVASVHYYKWTEQASEQETDGKI